MKVEIDNCCNCPHGTYSPLGGHTRCELEMRLVGEFAPIPEWCPIKAEVPVISLDKEKIRDFYSQLREHNRNDIGKRRLALLWALSQFTEVDIDRLWELASEIVSTCEEVIQARELESRASHIE